MITHRSGGFYLVPGVESKSDNKQSGTEYNIRKEIYKWGPCTTGMMIYQDFFDWDGKGVYVYNKRSEKIGGHAVVLMGWGEENGKLFWLVRNSWGSDWGKNDGYFKILPAIHDWSKDSKRIKDGIRVKEDFTYTSNNNTEWMSIENLKNWIESNKESIGNI
jgi:hypothetical protein